MTLNSQKKRNIFCIGETLLDIIFKEGKAVISKPGGAMLNTAVSLGLCGLPVELITDFGQDAVGEIIARFLHDSRVSTSFADRYQNGRTALALAMLDEHQNASYSFYKDFPQVRLNISFPTVNHDDLIAFGSFYALTTGIREKLKSFILMSREKGATILYDPNFRTPHLPELPVLKPYILENMSMADLVRGSDEDFFHIFRSSNGKDAYSQLRKAGCERLIYTRASEVEVFIDGNHRTFIHEPIQPVSTIGAGDAFNAGLLYYLFRNKIGKSDLPLSDMELWAPLVAMGTSFAREVCLGYDNYISPRFAESLSQNAKQHP